MDIVVTDLVVVGAGASGLLAAVAARRLGHEVLVVEASELAGGTTALSDGRLWLPGNHLMAKLGTKDSAEEAAAYLEAVLGAETTASPAERRASGSGPDRKHRAARRARERRRRGAARSPAPA